MNMEQYTEMFIEESREYLQVLNSCLLKLEKEPNSLSILNEIFRSVHTIKGMSATMGFAVVAELTHEMENLLDVLRQGTFLITPDIVDVLLKCLDKLEQMVENVASGESDSKFKIEDLVQKIKRIMAAPVAKTTNVEEKMANKTKTVNSAADDKINLDGICSISLDAAEKEKMNNALSMGRSIYEVGIHLQKGTLLKSARAYLLLNVIDEMGELIKTDPEQEALESEHFELFFKALFATDSDIEQARHALMSVSEVENVDIRAIVGSGSQVKSKVESTLEVLDNKLLGTLELTETEKAAVVSSQRQGLKVYKADILLRKGTLLKSARSFIVLDRVDSLGTLIKVYPSREELEKEKFDLNFWLIIATDEKPEVVQQLLSSVSEVDEVKVSLYAEEMKEGEQDMQGNIKEEPEKTESIPALVAADKEGVAEDMDIDSNESKAVTATAVKNKSVQSVRVDIEKLDALLNLTGELVINKTRLEQIAQASKLDDLLETIEQMDRVTTDLQVVVMKVRMVQVGQVFNRFPRMVRDLSRDLKKDVELVIEGEETELDRTVIDEIGDPLVHLIRNAIDHALESPEERKAKGKSEMGIIRLTAHHEGNNVVIMVTDNGKGIDAEVIKRKALEKGLLKKAEADKMDNSEALKLLFAPGFSTAQQVTDLSGRGVGLDVVKTKIEALGGSVDVETRINEGSRFIIRLPLTLAIIQALLVNVAGEIYAIPLGTIDSTIAIKPADINTVQKQEVILLRGNIIPIVRLSNILQVPQAEEMKEELFVVVVHQGDKKAGIVVDTLIGQQEIVIKSLGSLLSGIKQIAGATILGNGQVALILDVASIMV